MAICNNDSSLPPHRPMRAILALFVYRHVETKSTVFMIYPMHNWGAILAIYNGLRMRKTFQSVTGSQTPVLLSITYSSKSEIDKTLRGGWPGPLRQAPHERTA